VRRKFRDTVRAERRFARGSTGLTPEYPTPAGVTLDGLAARAVLRYAKKMTLQEALP
jgi:hypothetical protein